MYGQSEADDVLGTDSEYDDLRRVKCCFIILFRH